MWVIISLAMLARLRPLAGGEISLDAAHRPRGDLVQRVQAVRSLTDHRVVARPSSLATRSSKR